ncbi:unnamed protein product [Linum trigynum]|uniref:Uncharacterized protein n=1 Tax=Linum trigynum TaxID=586398 RepID=A0AAV2EU22_9ROSI
MVVVEEGDDKMRMVGERRVTADEREKDNDKRTRTTGGRGPTVEGGWRHDEDDEKEGSASGGRQQEEGGDLRWGSRQGGSKRGRRRVC